MGGPYNRAMFERFTERARRVVVLSQEEARLLNHNYIGTEHVLLGLIHEDSGIAARALGRMGIHLEAVRGQVIAIIGQGSQVESGHIPFTPRAKKVMELSMRESLQLGHNYIGTEHLLLGLIREGEGVGAQVLYKLGADLHSVRKTVIQLLAGVSSEELSGVMEEEIDYPENPYDRMLAEDAESTLLLHSGPGPPDVRRGGVMGLVNPLRIGPREIGLLVLLVAGVLAGDSGSAWYAAGAIAAIVAATVIALRTVAWSWWHTDRWARAVGIVIALAVGTAAVLFFASAI